MIEKNAAAAIDMSDDTDLERTRRLSIHWNARFTHVSVLGPHEHLARQVSVDLRTERRVIYVIIANVPRSRADKKKSWSSVSILHMRWLSGSRLERKSKKFIEYYNHWGRRRTIDTACSARTHPSLLPTHVVNSTLFSDKTDRINRLHGYCN